MFVPEPSINLACYGPSPQPSAMRRAQPEQPKATVNLQIIPVRVLHASLRCLGERGNAQLKWFRVLATELRCRPGRCTRMIKAVLTVYYREHHAAAGGTIWYSGRQLAPRPVPAQAPASLVADDAVINYQVIEREWKSRFYNLCSRR